MPIRGAGLYALAGAVALAGIGGAIALLVQFFTAHGDPQRFLAPGSISIDVAKPGTHVIWHEHRTLFEGKSWDVAEKLPSGIRYRVIDAQGVELPIQSGGSGSSESGATRRIAVAQFEAISGGRHTLSVAGAFEPRVLSVGPSLFGPLLRAFGGAFAAALLGIGAGVAIGLYAFLQAAPAAKGPSSTPAPPTAADEQRLVKLAALAYGLQAASLLFGITLIAAVVIGYLKRDAAAGSWLESHFRWQIRTFWWTLLWSVIGLASVIVLVGIPILFAITVWFVYRVVKGWSDLNEKKPLPG